MVNSKKKILFLGITGVYGDYNRQKPACTNDWGKCLGVEVVTHHEKYTEENTDLSTKVIWQGTNGHWTHQQTRHVNWLRHGLQRFSAAYQIPLGWVTGRKEYNYMSWWNDTRVVTDRITRSLLNGISNVKGARLGGRNHYPVSTGQGEVIKSFSVLAWLSKERCFFLAGQGLVGISLSKVFKICFFQTSFIS